MIRYSIIFSFALSLCVPGVSAKPARGLRIVVAADAPEPIRRAAAQALAAVKSAPQLSVLASEGAPASLTDTAAFMAAGIEERAYHHCILIGLANDPAIRAAWQREARSIPGGFYVFGVGHLTGDIGYVESDRNPWLHSKFIKNAPFETQTITLTGSTPLGVTHAVKGFLSHGLTNGVIAAPGWKRPEPSLLERDPLAPNFTVPPELPAQFEGLPRIGLSSGSEDELRAVLGDTGVTPKEIWLAKYYTPGAWDASEPAKTNALSLTAAAKNYLNGLHRRAYGNSLWCARFANNTEANSAGKKIAGAAKLKADGPRWLGTAAAFSWSNGGAEGSILLWVQGNVVLMSTLPKP